MNSWNFSGNLGRDAETRYTAAGDAVVSFSVGVKSGFGDKATTTWARCSMFGRRGESVAPYLVKGQLVGVSGEVSMREWQDKDGLTRTSLEVRVNDLTLLGKRDDSGAQNTNHAPQQQRQTPQQQRPQAPQQSAPQRTQVTAPADIDDDIPFAPHGHGYWRAI